MTKQAKKSPHITKKPKRKTKHKIQKKKSSSIRNVMKNIPAYIFTGGVFVLATVLGKKKTEKTVS
jgi:hypothetical protein